MHHNTQQFYIFLNFIRLLLRPMLYAQEKWMAWGEEKRENILQRGQESGKPVVTGGKDNAELQMHKPEELLS